MKKIKPIILMFIITLSFLLGVGEIKAADIKTWDLPTCNIGFGTEYKGYGNVNAGAPGEVNAALSAGISRMNEDPKVGSFGIWDWDTKKKFTIHLTAKSRKDNLGKIEKFNIVFYHDKDPENGYKEDYPMCQLTQDDFAGVGSPYMDINFDITDGHIDFMKIEMMYSFDKEEYTINKDITVRKEKGDTQSVKNTTTAAQTQNGTTPKEKITVSDNSYKEDEGSLNKYKGTGKDITELGGLDTSGACIAVSQLFDEYWPYVMITVPIVLIVMIALDFFKAMVSNDADAIKKSGTNTVKRTIAAVLLLALPAIVDLVLGYFGIDFCF